MLPKHLAPPLEAFILSGLMSLLVSGISTYRATALAPGFVAMWMTGWFTAWLVAFPTVLVVAPLTRRAVSAFIVRD